MTWVWVLTASALCYLLKVAGNLVPHQWLENARFAQVAGMVTVGLLAAMVLTQTFADGQALALDARVAGLAAAVAGLLARAPFLVVVVLGAAVTALTRLWFGW